MRAEVAPAFAEFGLSGEPGTDAFWATARGPASIPADDGGWDTLFLWRGSAASIDFESWSKPVPLRRFGDTDCWHARVRMPARLRVTYQFRAGDDAYADPFNPVGAGGDRSIAATPDAPDQPHWPAVGSDDVLPVPRTRIRWASERLGGRRTVRVHAAGGGGPVVLLLDGDDWLYLHPAMTAFDAAVADGTMPPVTLVFLRPRTGRPSSCAAPSCGRRSGTNCFRWSRSPAYRPTSTALWSPGRASAA
ncbi:esterase [Streptomyces alboflavus]|uniref:Esterase n=1 Tax=Streptomyces alboflavus TaxID=67267 RepID=A0A1Z1WQE0_9ACTN|nr:esterase [Streptomyces alboflavus]